MNGKPEPEEVAYASFFKPNDGSWVSQKVVLDTGSKVNAISRKVALDLDLDVEAADGFLKGFRPEVITPCGKATLRWYFWSTEGKKEYEEVFWVVDTCHFEVLISGDFIWQEKIFDRLLPR
ncbi:hypothetical protein GP486_000304 [Trichoglossum hirsutum]|uniref:Uncharacterized protein n=1 Tax=Trichoglossum hirsutum TaxID=265104 RepID=A0A9P8LJA5_9PEZI|nr:hypothetical protein GP486_000304 [Trichoglossum hirsutum]